MPIDVQLDYFSIQSNKSHYSHGYLVTVYLVQGRTTIIESSLTKRSEKNVRINNRTHGDRYSTSTLYLEDRRQQMCATN